MGIKALSQAVVATELDYIVYLLDCLIDFFHFEKQFSLYIVLIL